MASILALFSEPAPKDTCNRRKLIRDSLTEFVATILFVYAGTLGAVSTGRHLVGAGADSDAARVFPVAFCFGISIMVLAYSISHISGGHMNPAVSFLMFLQRQISLGKMFCYWIAQFSGALLASVLVWGSSPGLIGVADIAGTDEAEDPTILLGSTTLASQLSVGKGFFLELMGSIFFYLVVSQTTLDKKGIGNSNLAAIPIGFALVVVHVGLIPFTGCGVNPARTFGPSVVVCMADAELCPNVVGGWYWIYYVAPFLAAWLVAEVTRLFHMDVGERDLVIVHNSETKDRDRSRSPGTVEEGP